MKKHIAAIVCLGLFLALFSGCTPSFGVTGIVYADADRYTAGGASLDGVTHIEIEWLNGHVTLATHTGNTVSFSETANRELDEHTMLHYYLEGTTLHIKYCESGLRTLSQVTKYLTVQIPASLALGDVTVSAVSAGVRVEDITIDRVEVSTVSGGIYFGNTVVRRVKCESVSGDVEGNLPPVGVDAVSVSSVSGNLRFSADVRDFSAETTSGDVSLSAKLAPSVLSIESISGNVTLLLPENLSAILRFDSVSGSASSGIPHTVRDRKMIFGSGDGEYDVETVSGNLRIDKIEG